MAGEQHTNRRSDEIRRRRANEGHAATWSTGQRAGQNAGQRARRHTAAHDVSRQPPATVPARRAPRRGARGSAAAAPPPVMARSSGPASSMARPVKHNQTRGRRYDVSVNTTPGAELRLPTLPRLALGWRVVSAVLAALAGLVLYQLWHMPHYQVQAAAVDGLQRLSPEDVNAVLAVAGEPVFALNPAALEKELSTAFPEFAAVGVDVTLPNTVVVTVTERLPVLIWTQEGRTELVDAEGMAFPPRSSVPQAALPRVEASGPPPSVAAQESLTETLETPALPLAGLDLITGKPAAAAPVSARPFLAPEMVTAILTLNADLPADTVLRYAPRYGLWWEDPRGWVVYFGSAQDIPMKLRVYKTLVETLETEGNLPVLVSVQHVHAPYYRVEE